VLHPRHSGHFTVAEDNAIAALGEFDRVRIMLASDLGRSGQNAAFSSHPELRADIVISGLPDKGEPLTSAWLEHLQPKLIIIADSESPATRRASADLLKRLNRTGAVVLSTHESGAVTIQIRDGVWRVQTARPLNATAPIPGMDDRDARDE
jgi:beta-lactamase superfamily II metal-dependent hydrolase